MHTVYTSYSLDSAAVSTIIFTTSSTIIVEIFISSYVRTSYAVLEDVVLLVHIVLLYDSIASYCYTYYPRRDLCRILRALSTLRIH